MPAQGSYVGYREELFLPSAIRSGFGLAVTGLTGYGGASMLQLQLEVTDVAGGSSPSLTVGIADTFDSIHYWGLDETLTGITAVGVHRIAITSPFTDRLVVYWLINGGGSFTFSLLVISQSPGS